MVGMLQYGRRIVTGKSVIGGFDSAATNSFAFANLIKMTGTLAPLTTASFPFQAYLDANGYPNNAPSNSLTENLKATIAIPEIWGSQSLVFKFSGTGLLYLQNGGGGSLGLTIDSVTGTGVTNSSTANLIKVSGTNVRVVFHFNTSPGPSSNNYYILFPIGTYTGMNNLVMCRASDEAAIDADPNAFNPDFIAQLVALNPKIIRALDWAGPYSHQGHITHRAPQGAVSFFGDRYPPECWAGSASGTGTVGDPYVVSQPSSWTGSPQDGDSIIVQFTLANTGSQPQLNVGGTGNVRITTLAPADLSAGGIAANSIWTLTYSSVYNYWTGRVGGFQQRAPIEQHIALCNQVYAHLWFNIPHRWGPADGTALATLVKTTLKGQLDFYPEFGNEVWNTVSTQTSFITNIGTTLGITSGNNENLHFAHGLLHRRMMGAITTAWGGPEPRLKRVMAFQAYGGTSQNDTYRFKGADIATVAQGGKVANSGAINTLWTNCYGAPNYTASPDRPIDYADVLAYATYYSGGELQQFDVNYVPTNLANLPSKTITGISQANPGVITYGSDPGYVTGDRLNIRSVVGMTQINGSNVTVTRLTATTYSMYTDATLGTTVDTTGYTAYSSGGLSGKFDKVSGLTSAANSYALGTPADIETAMAWVDNDLRTGSQYDSSTGVLTQTNTQNLIDFSTNIYPGWETIAANYDASRPGIGLRTLTVECYEGGFGPIAPSTASCTTLGISTGFATSIGNLIEAYKNDARFQTLFLDQWAQFMAKTHSRTPANYIMHGPSPWALFTGGTYTGPGYGTPYQSWYANVTYNH
jgi:hypothetical protein